jgi:hypothetical protein
VHVAANPAHLDLPVGDTGSVTLTVTNTSALIDRYRVRVFGLDPEWVTSEPAEISLFPGENAAVLVTVHLPDGFPAGRRDLTVHVQSENDASEFALTPLAVAVGLRPHLGLRVEPSVVTGGSAAGFDLLVVNEGNATVEATAGGLDPEDAATFEFAPGAVVLPPGHRDVVRATVRAPRPWFGQPRPRVLTFAVAAPQPVETMATFLQRPRIGRGLLSLLGLMAVAAIFAAVLSQTFDDIVQRSKVQDQVLQQALKNQNGTDATVPVQPSVLTGKVVLDDGKGVGGVEVAVFDADSPLAPLASTATATDGSYAFGRLAAKSYKLKYTGAGFANLWYPKASSPEDGQAVAVATAQTAALDDVVIAGEAGSVAGKVIGTAPTGAKATLVVPGTLDPSTPAVVAEVDVGADGAFAFPSVPSPAAYQLVVTKPGSAAATRDVVVGPAQAVTGVEVFLGGGDGTISGRVIASGQVLGGATVSAGDGTNSISTVSLTGDNPGSFALRGLATPGRYTVSATMPGYATASVTVTLASAQAANDTVLTLLPATGSISGTVTLAGGPAGGVVVSAQSGSTVIKTTTASAGDPGTYVLDALPAPGTYTLTFTRDGLVPQSRLVDLDPASGAVDRGGIDATLVANTSVVHGVVRDRSGNPVPHADVSLTDGRSVRSFVTADDPAGAYTFASVPPGSYTLSAGLPSTSPDVVLVTMLAADDKQVDVQLSVQASLSGVVNTQAATGGFAPAPGLTVRLFAAASYPTTAAATVTTGPDGSYTFTDVVGATDYIVAVYASPSAADPLAIQRVQSQPGAAVTIAPFNIPPAP